MQPPLSLFLIRAESYKGKCNKKRTQRQSQNAEMRGTDTSSTQTFSKSGKGSTVWEVLSYLRVFDRHLSTCYSMTVSFPLFFSLQMLFFLHERHASPDVLFYPDKLLHTSILSVLIQYLTQHFHFTPDWNNICIWPRISISVIPKKERETGEIWSTSW